MGKKELLFGREGIMCKREADLFRNHNNNVKLINMKHHHRRCGIIQFKAIHSKSCHYHNIFCISSPGIPSYYLSKTCLAHPHSHPK